MAAKRIASSAVDWARFAAVCPKNQMEIYRVMKAKHDGFMAKAYLLPDSLPKIDFAAYKSRLPNPAMADQFEAAYAAVDVPYPKDQDGVLAKVQKESADFADKCAQHKVELQGQMAESKKFLEKIHSLPSYEEMTPEMYNYYFPETSYNKENPILIPGRPIDQPWYWIKKAREAMAKEAEAKKAEAKAVAH
jgi:F-type H+-transporting ATPase subunit d